MSKKARQVLNILGRSNATFDCVQKIQSVLHTKKNAQEILDKIIKEILHIKEIPDNKIQKIINLINRKNIENAKLCIKCFEIKDISDFYFTSTNKNLHCWCKDCRREYDRLYKQKVRR